MYICSKKGALLSTFFYLLLFIMPLGYTKSSSEQSSWEQQYHKGFTYSQNGQHKEAFKVMHSLALQGHSHAKHNVALSYIHGLGTTKNIQQAEFWLREAHKDNVLDATVELAHVLYHKGEHTDAIALWEQAANHNDEYALFNLAMVAFEQHNTQTAKRYLLLAKQFNHPDADAFLQQYF